MFYRKIFCWFVRHFLDWTIFRSFYWFTYSLLREDWKLKHSSYQGCQVCLQCGSYWPQMGQIQDIFRSRSDFPDSYNSYNDSQNLDVFPETIVVCSSKEGYQWQWHLWQLSSSHCCRKRILRDIAGMDRVFFRSLLKHKFDLVIKLINID